MKTLGLTLLALLISGQAFAANPTAKDLPKILANSATLRGIQAGVAKDYSVPHCKPFKVVKYDRNEGALAADAYCTYVDSSGDASGVWIQVKGVFWDSEVFVLENASFTFAG